MSKRKYEDGRTYFSSPLRAIRELCCECNDSQNFSKKENDCTAGGEGTSRCPIFPFRFGRNPFRAKSSKKQIEAGRRLAAMNKEKKSL